MNKINNELCVYCGKFVSLKEVGENVKGDFTPDTHFTSESMDFYHVSCKIKDIIKKNDEKV